jgi:hypothetical protein
LEDEKTTADEKAPFTITIEDRVSQWLTDKGIQIP